MRARAKLFLLFAFISALAVLCLGGCGGRNGDNTANLTQDTAQDAALAPLDRAPETLDTSVAPTGRTAASVWSGCPGTPPPQGPWSADSSGANPVSNAFDGVHSNTSTWQGATSVSVWDLYYGFGTNPVAPALELDFLAVDFFNDASTPDTVRLYTSNDPCGAGWTDRGLLSNAWDASNPYVDLGSLIQTNYIWIHMEDAGTAMAIRDVDWEPVNLNVGAHAWPSYNADVYYPSKAFDGSPLSLNSWVGKVGAGTWNMYYGFASPTRVEMVTAGMFNINYRPTTMNLYISDTGTDGSWTLVGKMGPLAKAAQYVGQTTSYVRIEMSGNPPSNAPYITEVTWDIPVGASSGDSLSTGYYPDRAFDGNPSLWWAGDNTQSEWELFYRYPGPTYIDSISITFLGVANTPQTTRLHCYDGGSWSDLGTFPLSADPTMTVDDTCEILRFEMHGTAAYPSAGLPIIKDILMGTGWLPVGAGGASGDGISGSNAINEPKIVLDSTGAPIVVWGENVDDMYAAEYEVHAKRWNGSAWVELGSAVQTGIIADQSVFPDPAIDIDSSDHPFVVWQENHFSPQMSAIYGKQWNGSAWIEVGGSASGAGISDSSLLSKWTPDVAIGANDNIFVTWYQASPAGTNIFMKYSSGGSWSELGGSASGNAISNTSTSSVYPAIAASQVTSYPVVAWMEYLALGDTEIYLKKWNGSAWVELGGSASGGGISNTSGMATSVALAMDSSDNIYVAYQDNSSGDYDVFVKKWNGSTWSTVGNDISGNAGMSGGPSIAVDTAGNVYVAWMDNSSGVFQIYVKKYDGASWSDVGVDSSTGAGISDSTVSASSPDIAVSSTGAVFSTWEEAMAAQGFTGRAYVKYYVQ